MKYVNQLGKEGKLTVHQSEDRGKPEYALKKERSLGEAPVCLECQHVRCSGEKKCFKKEAERRGVEKEKDGMDGCGNHPVIHGSGKP